VSAALALLLALVVAGLAPGAAAAADAPTSSSTSTTTTVAPAERSGPAPDRAPSSSPVVEPGPGAETGDDQPEVLTGDAAAPLVAGRTAAGSCCWSVRPVVAGAPVTAPD
jgi:hypothetical protein